MDDHFRTAPTENSGPKFKFRLLHSLVKLITFQNFKPKRVNKSEMLQNFSQTQGTVFHSSACISSSEGFFKNRSAHFCGKWLSSGACPSQIAILFSLWLKFLMKWKPTYIYGDLNFSGLPAGFRKPFQLAETRGFADHFLKISRSYTSGNLNYSNFPCAEQSGQLWCLAPYLPKKKSINMDDLCQCDTQPSAVKNGSLMSLDACNSGVSSDVREPISLQRAVQPSRHMNGIFTLCSWWPDTGWDGVETCLIHSKVQEWLGHYLW